MKRYTHLLASNVTMAARKVDAVLMHNPRALLLAAIMMISTFAYVVDVLVNEARYRLSNESVQIIGDVNKNLADKLKLDKNLGAYRFNPQAITPEMTGEDDPAAVAAMLASQKQQTGGGGKDTENLYSLDLPIDPNKGTKIYDANSKTSFKLIPEFAMGNGRTEQGRVVYPLDEGGQAVYSVKGNGIKEDIVLTKPRGDKLSFSYRLELPKTLEARLDDRGNLGIYSVDPMVSSAVAGAIENGVSSGDTERLKDVQQNGTKTHLAYLIPAPTIIQSGDRPQSHKAKAMYKLDGDRLTVGTSGLEKLTYPISIDPSVVVTSTSEFAAGNNEGNISFDADAISRGPVSGAKVGTWNTTTAISPARTGHTAEVYNGYLYIIGGDDFALLNDVQYAPINANGTIGAWTATTSFTAARSDHTSAAYNGYLYVIGGTSGVSRNDVQYAPINANGTIGAWTATTSFATARKNHTTVAYDGYLYVIGGANGANMSDVQYAPINANGTIGAWTATTSFTTGRENHTSAVYNGYLYVLGGYTTDYMSDVQYAPINANGTIGAWTVTTSFTTGRSLPRASIYGGYLYISGGYSGSYQSDVQYAPINANGTIGAWTATTSFTTGRTGFELVENKGYLYVIGGYTTAGYLNDIQYSQIDIIPPGPTVGMTSWAATTSLGAGTGSNAAKVTTRANHVSLAHNNYLYVIGGTGANTNTNAVHHAPINSNGTIGTWALNTALPAARAGLAATIVNGYMYVVGGQDANAAFTSTVYYAVINANGTLGTWTTTTSISAGRSDMGLEYYNGRMYTTGGITTGGTRVSIVEYAVVNANGTLGTWTAATSLPETRGTHASAVYNGYLYVFGGSDGTTTPSAVLYALINANGTLGTWSNTTTMLEKRTYIDARIYQGHVIIAGGWDGGSVEYATTTYAKFNANGTIGEWKSGASFTPGRDSHGMEIYNGYAYITGGWNGSTKYGDVQYSKLSYAAPVSDRGTVGSWGSSTSFSTTRELHESVAHNGYLYVIGGYNSSSATLADVQYAPINSNGTIGSWAATTSLSQPREAFVAAVFNDYLYVIGGYTGSSTLADVQYAPINSNGTIGSWAATTSFSTARSEHAAVAYNGYLYVIGGYTPGTGVLADVQYAPINSNGSIGSWAATTSFSTARSEHAAVAYNGYLYIAAGNGGSVLSGVQYAPINANGTIGTWTMTTGITGARHDHTFVVYGKYLFVIGGYNSSGATLADVQYAPINADGTVGVWTTTTALASGRATHASAIYNGYIYTLGGYTEVGTSDVLRTQLNATPLTAQYTKVVNLGQVSILNGVTLNGLYAGGQKVASIKVAGADGVFGGWQSTSGLSQAPISNVQYVMFRISIDDSFGRASLGVSDGRSTINDVTVNYTLPSALTPDNRLRHNKYFDTSGLLQPSELQ